MAESQIRLAADVGGTFTDLVVVGHEGRVLTRKVPSTPPDFESAVLAAVDEVLRDEAVVPGSVTAVCHGTTVATNAVLENRGAKTALITTRGFRDVLEMRRMRAPQLYDLFFVKPPAMVDRYLRFEVGERLSAHGGILSPLDVAELDPIIEQLTAENVESVAICFLHAYAFPAHEQQAGDYLLRHLPGLPVSLSHEVLRQRREYERTATTVVNAYVRPIMHEYLASLGNGLEDRGVEAPLLIMQSAGGLTPAADAARNPVYALESGPAAGVLAAANAGSLCGIDNIISFDMGGTTAKAAMIEAGEIPYTTEYEVGASLSAGNRLTGGGGELIMAPAIAIGEVGAGGGSIAAIDGAGALKVGPRSAAALPGPVCYQRGGTQPTVTDANVALGYIRAGRLAGGDVVIDEAAATQTIREQIAEPLGLEIIPAALGVHDIANAMMLRALREVSVHRGRDPRDFTMVAFGGSGPVHAANLARELGMTRVLVPPRPGVFSAIGLLVSGIEHHHVRSCQLAGAGLDSGNVQASIDEMRQEMFDQFRRESVPLDTVTLAAGADVHFAGEASVIRIPVTGGGEGQTATVDIDRLCKDFIAEHARLYGHAGDDDSVIELCAVRLVGRTVGDRRMDVPEGSEPSPTSQSRHAAFADCATPVAVPIVTRAELESATAGPLFIDEYDATIVVPPGWAAKHDAHGNIIMTYGAATS
ncbi:MAG: hydantoinase/oxoprolinase family protein [Lentisphaeria bacterium]|nr:hydantoinase/oxoprolinase family protein [Lentisphaeria bacterium]